MAWFSLSRGIFKLDIIRDSRSKGRRRVMLYRTSLMHPFLLYFHSFFRSKRKSPEIQCSIPMILTKLPCSTGHIVHILLTVLSALQFQLTALHRWLLNPSLNFCSLQLLSVVSGCYFSKNNNSDFPKFTLQSARFAYPIYHFIPCLERMLQNHPFRLILQMWTMKRNFTAFQS